MRIDGILSKRLQQFQQTGGAWAKAVCPFHPDTKPSFFINMDSGVFHCFGCGVKGRLQELLDRLGIKGIRAADVVAERQPERRRVNEINELPDYILGAYRSCPTRLLQAGFDKKLLEEYEIGFDAPNYRITFPIRDINGTLVAVSGRNLEGEPKYQIYLYEDEFPGYAPRPKDHLWNLNKLANQLQKGDDPLFIVEGFKAALWLTQYGYQAVALIGAQMTRKQKRLLSQFDVPLVLCLDNDSAGRAATLVNYMELSRIQLAKVVEYPPGIAQPDDMEEELLHKTLQQPQEFRRFYKNVLSTTDEEGPGSLDRRRKALIHKSRKAGQAH